MARDDLLTDIALHEIDARYRPVYRLGEGARRVPGKPGPRVDFATISGPHNLGQALLMRLLTPRGELAELGHPAYGSRLFDLVGRQNTEQTRGLVKLAALEALAEDPRVEDIEEVRVSPSKRNRGEVEVMIRVKAVGEAQVVTIGPIVLEVSP